MDTKIPQEAISIVPKNNLHIMASYLNGDMKPDTWQEFVSIGEAARGMADLSRWVIGKTALEVCKKWGIGELKRFCDEIGYTGEVGTVNQYRWVVEHYISEDGSLPISIEGERLSFSFYRAAAKTQNPMEWIEKAQDENMTVTQLQKQIKGLPSPSECQHTHTKTLVICEDCGVRVVK